jgi:hypothetical protein
MPEATRIDRKFRHGQVGDTWGNLLMDDGALAPDQEIAFEGDEEGTRYWITRVNEYPLDTKKRLYYYQAHPRSMDSTMERPFTKTVQ